MTYTEIYNSIITNWCNKLKIPVANAGYDLIVMSKVFAFGMYQLIKIIDGISNNIWVGSMQASKLLEVGQDKVGRGLFQAVKGEYICSTTANGVGDIPEGSIFTIEKNGTIFSFESTQLVAGGSDIPIRALEAGTESILIATDILTSKQNLTYASNEITVTQTTETAVDTETIAEYRAVVVAFERLRLGNGNASDYVFWVTNVNGLKTSYPYTANGEAGKAVIYCESTDEDVLVPSAALINDAIDAIKYDSDGISQPPVEFFEFVNTTYILPVQISGIKIELVSGNASQLSDVEDLVKAYLLIKRPFLHTINKTIEKSSGLNSYENTVSLIDIISILANSGILFTNVKMYVNIRNISSYVEIDEYAVGYRGGDAYSTSFPALPTFYGECPRLESVVFI